MKSFIFLFFSILTISLVVASPAFELQSEDIQAGETIFGTITTSGNFTKQIEASDITFYEGRKKVFFEHDITFYRGTHYLYIYTTREGNFTIKIKDILYKDLEILNSKTIEKQITVSSASNQTLSVKPGFIITSDAPQIKLINLGSSNLTISYDENSTTLKSAEFKKIKFKPSREFTLFAVSSYKTFTIPIIYLGTENTTINNPIQQVDLKQDPEILTVELTNESELTKTIKLFNFGEENLTITKIEKTFSFIEISYPEKIIPRGIENLTFNISPEIPGQFEDIINITYEQYNKTYTISIPVKIFILPTGSTEEDFNISEETCADKQGTICLSNEICDTKAFFANDGYCCPGNCVKVEPSDDKKPGSGYSWFIGLIILITLGLAGFYLYKKHKEITPPKPDEKIKQISDKYTERMSGKSSARTTGNLTKS